MAIIQANVAQFVFEVSGLGVELRVVKVRGEEKMSAPFHFQFELASLEADINFDDVTGKTGIFKIHDYDVEEARVINGIVSRFERTGEGKRFTHYYLELVPIFHLLTLRTNNRIFQNQNTQEIIQSVLDDAGIPAEYFQFSLTNSYEPREYCVQYNETDLNFISRLMEEEGIFYYFEHSDNDHTMVMADRISQYESIVNPEVRYNTSSMIQDEGCVFELRYSESIRSGAVKLKDYNFLKPALNLKVNERADTENNLEVYEYASGYAETERGDGLARVKLESLRTMKKVITGKSRRRSLKSGFKFTLADHPKQDYNREYVITSIKHEATQPQALENEAQGTTTDYTNEFIAIPSDVSFRPPQTTKKPRVEGLQSAVVVGPSGEEIYTDEYGRVKVQFHWDLIGTQNENSSCWIRVSQLWAGASWGAVFLPRIGQEVIVDFIEGDPDRPLITGRVYHAANLPPYRLPDEKTKSTIRSATTPGSATHNELLMEDKQDETQVVLSNAYGHKLVQDEKTQTITLQTRDQHVITLDDKAKTITITSINGHQLIFDDTDTENEGAITLVSTTGHRVELNDKNRTITAQTVDGNIFKMDDENRKIELTTSNNHSAVFDDDNESISITSSGGHHVTMDDGNDSITLEDGSGAHRFKIDAGGSGLLISTDSGSIDLEAPSGTIALKAVNIELNADMDCKLAGMNVAAEAGVEFKASGAMTTCEASGINTVSGSLVKIN